MDYKDNQGMKNILIFPKSLIKTFLERADGFAHLQGALKVISFVDVWSQLIAKKTHKSHIFKGWVFLSKIGAKTQFLLRLAFLSNYTVSNRHTL